MIEQGQVYAVEYNNFRRKHVNRVDREIFLIEVEIGEDEWHHLRDFPTDAIGMVGLQWTERSESPQKQKREPKPPKEPTLYGKFWKAMDKAGFHNRPDVRRWIECDSTDSEWEAKTRLRRALNVQSRAKEASPEFVLEWLGKASMMDGAIAFVENLKASLQTSGA